LARCLVGITGQRDDADSLNDDSSVPSAQSIWGVRRTSQGAHCSSCATIAAANGNEMKLVLIDALYAMETVRFEVPLASEDGQRIDTLQNALIRRDAAILASTAYAAVRPARFCGIASLMPSRRFRRGRGLLAKCRTSTPIGHSTVSRRRTCETRFALVSHPAVLVRRLNAWDQCRDCLIQRPLTNPIASEASAPA